MTTINNQQHPPPHTGRLVVHGWFADPQPFFIGGLAPKDHGADSDDDDDDDERSNSPDFVKASDVLDGALAAAVEALAQVGRVIGCFEMCDITPIFIGVVY